MIRTELMKILKTRSLKLGLLASVILCTVSSVAFAQGKFDQPVSRPLMILFALSGLALLPILITMTTSFIKIAVVLALVRNAMGTQQIPPNQIITGLAMILTFYVMTPVGLDVYRATQSVMDQGTNQGFFSQASFGIMLEAVDKGKGPVREFLLKHTHDKERALFYKLALNLRKPKDRVDVTNQDFSILVPAFIISELKEAFFIGFIIFLPFLVIDMVVANILLSLGMFQLSPITVSLPFKLLLFVLVDGWHLIAQGLIKGYL